MGGQTARVRRVDHGPHFAPKNQAIPHFRMFMHDGVADGLGCAIAGGFAVRERECVCCVRVCVCTGLAIGATGLNNTYIIHNMIYIYIIQVLSKLSVAQRREAVTAARSAAGALGAVLGNEASKRAAKALGILDDAGNGDILGYCSAGGLPVLEHLSLQERLDAVQKARRKSSEAGNQAKTATREVFDFNCVFDSNYGNRVCVCALYC